jgi:hypothetical protein
MLVRWTLWIAFILDPAVAGSSPELRTSNVWLIAWALIA